MSAAGLLAVEDLRVWFGPARRPLRAVDGVSLAVAPGGTTGLVGESGSGKTTLGRAVLRLERITAGRVVFDGADVTTFDRRRLKHFRRQAQMVFQDPFGSLNPRIKIGRVLEEVLAVHGLRGRAERRTRVGELLGAVGLDPACADRYPHEFSGGQRQRIGIARALAVDPRLIIADEPVSALDVSVQVQILNLLKDLQQARGLAYLFIAHDLAVVRYMCDQVVVMYLGRVMEAAPAAALFSRPAHPYTKALLKAVPDVRRNLAARRDREGTGGIPGDCPVTARALGGCPFHPRCPLAGEVCRREMPPLRELARGHQCACHFCQEEEKDGVSNVPLSCGGFCVADER